MQEEPRRRGGGLCWASGVTAAPLRSGSKLVVDASEFDNLLKDRIGGQFTLYVHPHFTDFEDKRVLVIDVKPAGSPAFMKDGDSQRFFVRAGASTAELTGLQMQQFIGQRFK
jgi:predicted HTH transcriptional regulator